MEGGQLPRSDVGCACTEEQMKSSLKFLDPLTAYVIGVLIVWAMIFAVGYFLKGPTVGHPLLHVFGGFLLGMLSMYLATRIHPSKSAKSDV